MSCDLTQEALAGYASADRNSNPYLSTSPSWYAWELGRQLGCNARPQPAAVRMGRGDSIWSNGVRWKFQQRATSLRFEVAA